MYRFCFKTRYKEYVELGLLRKSFMKEWRKATPSKQAEQITLLLIQLAKENPRAKNDLINSGTLEQMDLEAYWLYDPVSYHIESDLFDQVSALGMDYIRQNPTLEQIQRVCDFTPIMVHSYKNGKPLVGRGSVLCGLLDPDSLTNFPVYVAAETLPDRWVTSATAMFHATDDRLKDVARAMECKWHLVEPLIALDLERDHDARDITFNMICFQLGLALYEGNFPSCIHEGLPDNLKARPSKNTPKERARHLSFVNQHSESVGGMTTFVRRPHFRVLAAKRFKRLENGTPKVVLVKAAEVTLTKKQRSLTVEKNSGS